MTIATSRTGRTTFARAITLVALALLGWGAPVDESRAQTLYGSVVGAVTDNSGGALPTASVVLTNVETNHVLEALANDGGGFTFANVLPGTYTLKVTFQGFREFLQTGIAVSAGNVTRVDVGMQLGELSESITVASPATVLQTDKGDVRVELKSREITTLPLAAYRNYQSLMNLVPGATPPVGANTNDTPGKSLRSVVNGTNSNNNGTKLDGQVNMNVWLTHHLAYVPPAETIESVNISTASFEADQGMAGGMAVTVITKSGTNELRGSAFGFYGADELNARAYFAPAKTDSRRTTVGATAGGPIKKNRLFYFGSWEGMYELDSNFQFFNVPTARMRAGDFSEIGAQVIYDPATGAANGAGRLPFAGNAIPASRLSQTALDVQEYYPLPNLPGINRNYQQPFEFNLDRDNYDLKINWNRAAAHQVWGKLSVLDARSANLQRFGFEGKGIGRTRSYLFTLGHTWTLTPTTVLDGTVGLTRYDQDFRPPDYGVNYGLDVLGLPGTNGPDPRQSGFPWFATGLSTIGEERSWYPMTRHDGSFSLASNVTSIRGSHELRFGGELARHHLNHWQPEVGYGPRGGFTFGGGVTALRGGPQAPNLYNQYAAFLLGLTSNVGKSLQYELMTTREWQMGLYLRDRWQVNSKLTVSAGLRWEYYPLMTRADRGIELLDLSTMDVLLGGVGGNPEDLGIETSKGLFAPRVGVAYRLDDRNVLRAGYGLTYNPQPFARPLRGFFPLTIAANFVSADSFMPYGHLEDGIPPVDGPDLSSGRVPLPPTVTMRSPDPDNVDRGHIQSWNVAYERQLPFDVSVSTAYVGTKTTDGYAYVNINAGEPGLGAAGQPLFASVGRPAATEWFGAFTRANYHALQVAINRQYKSGLLVKGAYTYSKAMNEADDDGWAALSFNAPSQLARNYARAGFDRTHMFQVGFVYELPFARQSTGLVGALARGWQVNGIYSTYSGTPFTVTAAAASLNAPGNTQTADQIGEIVKLGDIGPGTPFFDPTAWRPITEARYGNSGRNSVRGPGQWNLDLSVFRGFTMGRYRIEARAEAFNLTNTPKFGNPNANVSGANFMAITSASGERNVRLGLRFQF
ncbi:Outer membrane receptor for ferrienterochelin and colicins [Luteitalea pratensis]|uniref:Outer membrane receptor for ferrienterochelin and colicins n=1 Tax=Luteitalea pratensis TaxID=1855912 RepID=A0A143PVL4_LUTPR|nr:TonB-dependent receptor [Luteitalea pratensis]AMY11874.1 Outer membrane receptor for ferrienterochelin and colicins [Luteitalea pratensis]